MNMSLTDQKEQQVTFPEIDLENPEMIHSAVTALANALLKASDLMKTVRGLQDRLDDMERDLSQARHYKEVADAAYNTVNAARIDAENQLSSARSERAFYEDENKKLVAEMVEVRAKVVEVEAEVLKLKAAHEQELTTHITAREAAEKAANEHHELYKMAQEDCVKLTKERDEAKRQLDAANILTEGLRKENEGLQLIIRNIELTLNPSLTKPANSHWETQPRDERGRWDERGPDMSL